LGGRERFDVATDRLHEHQLRHAREDVVAAGPRAAGLPYGDVQQGGEPSAGRFVARPGEVDGAWQRGQQGIEGPLVASEEAADEPGAVRAAAAGLADARQRSSRPGEK